jgi:hypothetical protein
MGSSFSLWHIVFLLFATGAVALWAFALLQISKSMLDATAKAIWVLIVVVAPFLGALAWFFVGVHQAPPLTKR